MYVLIAVVVFTIFLVGPVMIAARVAGAAKTGFGSGLLAVIVAALMSSVAESIIPNDLIAVAASVAAGTLAYSVVLGASLLGGFMISVISVGIQLVLLVPLVAMLSGASA